MLAAGIRLMYDKWSKEDAELCSSAHKTLFELQDSATPPYPQWSRQNRPTVVMAKAANGDGPGL